MEARVEVRVSLRMTREVLRGNFWKWWVYLLPWQCWCQGSHHRSMSKFIKWYTLNMCKLLSLNYTSMKLSFFNHEKLQQKYNKKKSFSLFILLMKDIKSNFDFLSQPFKCLPCARYCLIYTDNRHQSYPSKCLYYSFANKPQNNYNPPNQKA